MGASAAAVNTTAASRCTCWRCRVSCARAKLAIAGSAKANIGSEAGKLWRRICAVMSAARLDRCYQGRTIVPQPAQR